MRDVSEYLEVIISMVAVSTPFAIAPVFLAMTSSYDDARRRKNALLAALTVLITCIVAIHLGEAAFKAFSIGIPSFRVAGGILVTMTGIEMVREGASKPTEQVASEKDVGVVPIGIPLLAGPGLISTVIIQSQQFESTADNLILDGCSVFLSLLIFLCLLSAARLARMLGTSGLDLLTRVFGLILAALGVEFVSSGLRVLFPGWA